MFDLYEQMIDPVGSSIGAAQWLQDDTYVKRMVNGYETLCQVNADQLDDVLLTDANNSFLNKLLAVNALDPYDFVEALTTFSTLGLDTAYLPDADGNGVPDCATVQEGSVTWGENGAFTADTDSVVTFAAVIKTDGDVELLELGGAGKTSPLEGVVEAIPGVIGKIKDLVGKKNSDSADESDDAE